MDDQMKNVVGKTLCDFGRNPIILSTVVWENTDPAAERWTKEESTIGFLRYLIEGLLNYIRLFGSDMN